MNLKTFFSLKLLYCALLIFVLYQGCTSLHQKRLILSCSEENDLYRILIENNIQCLRFDTPLEAVEMAKQGSGILITACGNTGVQMPIRDGAHGQLKQDGHRHGYPQFLQ